MPIHYKPTNPVETTPIATLRPARQGAMAPPGFLPGANAFGSGFGLLEGAERAKNPYAVGNSTAQTIAAINAASRLPGASSVLDNAMAGQGVAVSKVEADVGVAQEQDLTPPTHGRKAAAEARRRNIGIDAEKTPEGARKLDPDFPSP